MKRRLAVVGSGISGLAVAWSLSREAQVTLFEAGSHFGGHANTLDLTLDGVTHGVDTGFLVFNHRTYPELVRLFDTLKVDTAPSDMSFSVQHKGTGLEWSGTNLNSVFAQRRNLLRPSFLGMLRDIVRFNRLTTDLALRGVESELAEATGEFLDRHRFGTAFRDGYFLPMIGCIWSCPTDQMLQFPIATLIRFCHNHGLIQVTDRPQWHTVRGGSRHYVQKMIAELDDARLNSPVSRVRRGVCAQGVPQVLVTSPRGDEWFDDVVLACHTDQSLAMLEDADDAERQWLGAIRYHRNVAVLHTDASVLPSRPLAWAAWNYERATEAHREQAGVCLHYLINRLQPLPWQRPVVVSLNPLRPIDPAHVVARIDYDHPVFDRGAVAAQQQRDRFQGRSGVWFCGAWTRYGFHEDGLISGLDVVTRLRSAWATQARSASSKAVAA